MKKVLHKLSGFKLGTTLMLIILVAIWSTPTLGLLLTSIRTQDSAANSGWWTALADPLGTEWTLQPYINAINGGMLDSLLNTLIVTIPATVLPLTVSASP